MSIKNCHKNFALSIFFFSALLFTRIHALLNNGALFYNFEGLWNGWRAKELLDGSGWGSIFGDPYFPAQGGSVVMGYAAALFFMIFGDNFFSLILVPIAFSLLIWVIFYLFLVRHFSRLAAAIFSFLFIFAPASFFRFSLYAIGCHLEAILFSALGLFFFFEIFFNKDNHKIYLGSTDNRNLYLIFLALGLTSGFGVYFYYTYLVVLFTIGLFWFIFDKGFFLGRYFYIFLTGFAVGLLPWITYNITHKFSGLAIHGSPLFSAIFYKNPKQIFHAFIYIVTQALIKHLGVKLYLIIAFSFVFLIFLNIKYLRCVFLPMAVHSCADRTKEIILIAYVAVFVSAWSILYIPVGFNNSEIPVLSARLYYIYPLLFILVGICFDRIFLLTRERQWPSRIPFVVVTAWLLGIGFSNYSGLFNGGLKEIFSWEKKISPLKIKGYSIRVDYFRRNEKVSMGFLGRDMVGVATGRACDEKLNEYFVHGNRFSLFNSENGLLKDLNDNPQLDADKKAYYYLLLGLNTGDLMPDYDIAGLNQLIAQKTPDKYRHYFYEGLSISLMHKRYNEVIKNIDFINMVPLEYRHYFLFGLGQIIGAHFDGKIRENKFECAISKFSPAFEGYLGHGFVTGIIVNSRPFDNIKEKYLPYLYRNLSLYIHDSLPSQDEVAKLLKAYSIGKDNEKYFYYGIAEALFRKNNNYRHEDIQKKIKEIIACNWIQKDYLYKGLGISMGHMTFGHINKYTKFIESFLNSDELSEFYVGYCISLQERYGRDFDRMKELIDENVAEGSRAMCYSTISWYKLNNDDADQ